VLKPYWIRFTPIGSGLSAVPDGYLSVLVGIQPKDYLEGGRDSQEDLRGQGLIDSKLELPCFEAEQWDYTTALGHCISELEGFQLGRGKDTIEAISSFFLDAVSSLEDAIRGRAVVTLNNQLCQQFLIPIKTIEKHIAHSKNHIENYYLLKEIGLQCAITRHLDLQPQVFREWYLSHMSGRISPPSKRPENWAISGRNRLIYALVGKLESHGFSKTRNDTNCNLCGCEVIAKACISVGLASPRSYETVRKIYFNYRSLLRG